LLKELYEVVAALDDALVDDKVSDVEFAKIYAEFREALDAFIGVFRPAPA